MSAQYEESFKNNGILSEHFYEPRNFTDECDDPSISRYMGTVSCRNICLTITQDIISLGIRTGQKLTIRGCSTKLTKLGFRNRTMNIMDRFDNCRYVKASDLFLYPVDDSVTVHVCSCLGDRCNGSKRSNSHTSIYSTAFFICIMLPFLLCSNIYNQVINFFLN
ncbi:Caenorhabditis elegans ly-6-related family-containing protein [Strongyloides ratti]|uniref:Caenorhabditis elegans ly-6-related family-containing protein n=1 Tax=Strongyloides ratti TaxID=34506 RepID=A0A090KXE3_STRRB|nr:Caenorhabditis elegans ly-6-related family-containing protein [Strongyloides ratti]CEF60552.1 Caenorhabditis elegans ly-6-related family-containing protein [Strongyloides ratti]